MKPLLLAVILWGVIGAIPTRSDTPPAMCALTPFIQVSGREFVNPAHLGAMRLPVFTPSDPSCSPNCQTRWGAQILIDGTFFDYSVEAEPALRKLVGAPVMP